MKVRVVYHGRLKDLTGKADEAVELMAPSGTVGELVGVLIERSGFPSRVFDSVAVAVNDAIVARDHALDEGAVVDLLPPVSGG